MGGDAAQEGVEVTPPGDARGWKEIVRMGELVNVRVLKEHAAR
jgi:hypothetical protein